MLVIIRVSNHIASEWQGCLAQFHLTYTPHGEVMPWCSEFRGYKSVGEHPHQPQGRGLDQGLRVLATIPDFSYVSFIPTVAL